MEWREQSTSPLPSLPLSSSVPTLLPTNITAPAPSHKSASKPSPGNSQLSHGSHLISVFRYVHDQLHMSWRFTTRGTSTIHQSCLLRATPRPVYSWPIPSFPSSLLPPPPPLPPLPLFIPTRSLLQSLAPLALQVPIPPSLSPRAPTPYSLLLFSPWNVYLFPVSLFRPPGNRFSVCLYGYVPEVNFFKCWGVRLRSDIKQCYLRIWKSGSHTDSRFYFFFVGISGFVPFSFWNFQTELFFLVPLLRTGCQCSRLIPVRTQHVHIMMMIAFITIKSSLVPLIEGLCAQIYFRFEISVVCLHLLLFFFVKKKHVKRKQKGS